ncbi:MAG: DUF4153 domain-containing protein [Granulosicoccaceae bacterium]
MSTTTWPARPLLLACLLGACAYGIYLLLEYTEQSRVVLEHWRLAGASALATGALGFGLTAVRSELRITTFFALLVGLLVGGISYWRLAIQWPDTWSFVSLAIALLVITPFFQASLASHWNNYAELHKQAWANVVVLLLALVFTGISFGMAHLLAELFDLVGIDLLERLLGRDDMRWILAGVAYGGAMGVLREHDHIINATQGMIQSVLSLLTAPLSLSLLGFLCALPFTGLQPLWEATRSTSPIVFVCAAGSILLLNAVIRDSDDHITAGRLIQLSARALLLVVAPLAAIAVASLSTRIQQYGWTPDRLWASLICAILLIYGLFYWIAALSNRRWSQRIRSINLCMALALSCLGLFLATPLLDFGAVASRDQVQRLLKGKVSNEDFDAAALAFDFGPQGRQALEHLDTQGDSVLANKIESALTADNRWQATRQQRTANSQQLIAQRLIVRPAEIKLHHSLLELLEQINICEHDYCYFLMDENGRAGTAVQQLCPAWQDYCEPSSSRYMSCNGEWRSADDRACHSDTENKQEEQAKKEKIDRAAQDGKLEVKAVKRWQLFVDGEPVNEVFNK